MFIDARTMPNGTRLAGDVCVVGSGAAGIMLARELESSGIDVVVLESGLMNALSPFGYRPDDWPGVGPLTPADDRIVPVAIQYSAPTRFGIKNREELRSSATTTVLLGANAIENARLLLAANRVHPRGPGSDHDLAGRYFMEHLYLDDAANVEGTRPLARDYARARKVDGFRIQWALALTEAEQRRTRIRALRRCCPLPPRVARSCSAGRARGCR